MSDGTYDTEYERVIPRDLFNEAKLLKCLGQLTLLIHEGKCDLEVLFGGPGEGDTVCRGFETGVNIDGGYYCNNIRVYVKSGDGSLRELELATNCNSKLSYPLVAVFTGYSIANPEPVLPAINEEAYVFNEHGSLATDFIELIRYVKDYKEASCTGRWLSWEERR